MKSRVRLPGDIISGLRLHQVTQGQAIAKLNEKEQEYRTFITSAIKELEAACEALLLDNGNAPTVEELNMQ